MSKQKIKKAPTSVEAVRLKPKKVIFIDGHYGFTQLIKIFDITDKVTDEYDSESTKWYQNALKLGNEQSSDSTPFLDIYRDRWYGHTFTAKLPGSDDVLAEWKGGWTSASKNSLIFPSESKISSHNITMECEKYFRFQDKFVVDSVQYSWTALNALSIRQFVLVKQVGGESTEVAKFWQPLGQIKQGGVVAVDTDEVDPVIAVLTNLVILRKQRLKYYEYS